jgi:hypothetical protein
MDPSIRFPYIFQNVSFETRRVPDWVGHIPFATNDLPLLFLFIRQ